MLFLKHAFKKRKSEVLHPKEKKITEEKMTINRLKHALEVAVGEDIDSDIEVGSTSRGIRKYTYSFDRHFMLTLINYDYMGEIKIEVRLKDDKHELVACAMCIKEQDVTEETIVVWRQKGPWCKIIENKVKHIEEKYQYLKKEEQRKKQEFQAYFSGFLPKTKNGLSQFSIPYGTFIKYLEKGRKLNIVNQKRQNYSNGTPFQIVYELQYIKIEVICLRKMEPYHVDLKIALMGNELKDLVIFDKRVNVEEEIILKEFGFDIVDYYINKLKEKIN